MPRRFALPPVAPPISLPAGGCRAVQTMRIRGELYGPQSPSRAEPSRAERLQNWERFAAGLRATGRIMTRDVPCRSRRPKTESDRKIAKLNRPGAETICEERVESRWEPLSGGLCDRRLILAGSEMGWRRYWTVLRSLAISVMFNEARAPTDTES